MDFIIGDRTKEIGKRLWITIRRNLYKKVCTDHLKAYEEFIPRLLHTANKTETYTVESFNAVLRLYLARLHRKTHCYTRCTYMVYYSILLLMYVDVSY
ncbi:MAG: hypothetical protein LBP53_03700 [Candidatus Peribacteria bacterium]|nr:hypothetical protein [Candidatus Peribacteria bacterium]